MDEEMKKLGPSMPFIPECLGHPRPAVSPLAWVRQRPFDHASALFPEFPAASFHSGKFAPHRVSRFHGVNLVRFALCDRLSARTGGLNDAAGARLHVGCLSCKVPAQIRQLTLVLPRRHHAVLAVDCPTRKVAGRESPTGQHNLLNHQHASKRCKLDCIPRSAAERDATSTMRLAWRGAPWSGGLPPSGVGTPKKGSLQRLPVEPSPLAAAPRIIRCLPAV